MQQSILFMSTDVEQYLRLKSTLSEFTCIYSVSLPEGVSLFNQQKFCLIVLNLSPILSPAGQEELLRSFRRAHPVPLIALCSEANDSNLVRLLDAGADQVLSVEVSDKVLAAYAHALINRYTQLDLMERELHDPIELRVGDFVIDLIRRHVCLKGKKIDLSNQDFELMLLFAQNPERVLTEAQISERVWNVDKEFHSGVSKPISRLRQKIEPGTDEPSYIRSVRGIGYQFMPDPAESYDVCRPPVSNCP